MIGDNTLQRQRRRFQVARVVAHDRVLFRDDVVNTTHYIDNADNRLVAIGFACETASFGFNFPTILFTITQLGTATH